MFAFAIKEIGADRRLEEEEAYEKYVFEKYRIKVDPEMIDERYSRKRVLFRSASANGRMLKLEKEEELARQMLSHKASFDMIRRMENLDDQCNVSELNQREVRSLISKKLLKDHEEEMKIRDAKIPNMEKVLHEEHLKIVVKMSNIKFASTNDIFGHGHDPERFLTQHEKKELQKQRFKEEKIKAKVKSHQPQKSMILGYQKKVQILPVQFNEDLLRTEY